MVLVLFPESSLTFACAIASYQTSGISTGRLAEERQLRTHPLMNVREIARGSKKQRLFVHTPEAMNLSILSL